MSTNSSKLRTTCEAHEASSIRGEQHTRRAAHEASSTRGEQHSQQLLQIMWRSQNKASWTQRAEVPLQSGEPEHVVSIEVVGRHRLSDLQQEQARSTAGSCLNSTWGSPATDAGRDLLSAEGV